MKRSRPRKVSRRPNKKYITKLDRIARAKVMQRDNHTCVRCGRSEYQGFKIDWSHVYTRANLAIRWDEDNSKALCYLDHKWWGQNSGDDSEGMKWFREKYPDRYERLQQKRHSKGPNPKLLYEELTGSK